MSVVRKKNKYTRKFDPINEAIVDYIHRNQGMSTDLGALKEELGIEEMPKSTLKGKINRLKNDGRIYEENGRYYA